MNEQRAHIIYLWEQFAAKKASPQQLDELFGYLENPANDEISLSFLEQYFAVPASSEHFDREYWLAKLDDIKQGSGSPAGRVSFLKKWGWAAAAAALIGITIATFVSLDRRPAKSGADLTEKVISDVLPGGNKAVLTLAGGQTIILDSVANGSLAVQGNAKITKLANGQLTYTAGGNPGAQVLYNTMTTPRGGEYKIRLPDGTDVWLNCASSITYPTAFTGKDRSVRITGEAYFEVAKDAFKPFHVKAGDMEVEVLGTHFNINSYSDEESIKTTLLEGSVRVSGDGKESVILRPRQQAVIMPSERGSSGAGIKIVSNADTQQAVAWKDGLFRFNQADLPTVLRQLSRWYDVTIKYEGTIPASHFKGELQRDLTLAQVTSILSEMEVKFRIEGKTLVVTP